MEDKVKLYVFKEEDRVAVGSILLKNGYTVSFGKERRTPTGKTLDYFLEVVLIKKE